ncbi:hypothetical protein ACP275_08G111800 [Erythranthe tilingii]
MGLLKSEWILVITVLSFLVSNINYQVGANEVWGWEPMATSSRSVVELVRYAVRTQNSLRHTDYKNKGVVQAQSRRGFGKIDYKITIKAADGARNNVVNNYEVLMYLNTENKHKILTSFLRI